MRADPDDYTDSLLRFRLLLSLLAGVAIGAKRERVWIVRLNAAKASEEKPVVTAEKSRPAFSVCVADQLTT